MYSYVEINLREPFYLHSYRERLESSNPGLDVRVLPFISVWYPIELAFLNLFYRLQQYYFLIHNLIWSNDPSQTEGRQ